MFLTKSICTIHIPFPTRYRYICYQASSLIPRIALYRLRAVKMSFGSSERRFAPWIVLGPSLADVIVPLSLPLLNMDSKLVLGSWVASPSLPGFLRVWYIIATFVLLFVWWAPLALLGTESLDNIRGSKIWDPWTVLVKATGDRIFPLSHCRCCSQITTILLGPPSKHKNKKLKH